MASTAPSLPQPHPLSATPEQRRAFIASSIEELSTPELKLIELALCALVPDRDVEVPAGPDADLIRQCRRLHAIQEGVNLAYEILPGETVPDENRRGVFTTLLYTRWDETAVELMKLKGPTTAEGAREMAWVWIEAYSDGVDAAVKANDLDAWLSTQCAEYLGRPPADTGFGT